MSVNKKFTGIVVSTKMNKTVVVSVVHITRHRKYPKMIKRNRKFSAHNDLPGIALGDTVTIVETKPISKTKFFKVESKIGA